MNAADQVREGILVFDPGDGIYVDHFPGHPVVPGSLVIQAFLDLAGGARVIEAFRFRVFLAPGQYRYRMTLCRGVWNCELLEDEQVLASGKIRR